jgi:hypothetical protein
MMWLPLRFLCRSAFLPLNALLLGYPHTHTPPRDTYKVYNVMDVWRGGNDNYGTRRREIRKKNPERLPECYFRLLRLPPQLSARITAEETKGVNLVSLLFSPFSPMCYGAKFKRHCIYNATI